MPKPSAHQRIALTVAGLAGLSLGACFNGLDAQGLPCTSDVHCGPQLSCIDGFCGGSNDTTGSTDEVGTTDTGTDTGTDTTDTGTDTGPEIGPNQCEQPDQPFTWYGGPEETGVDDPFGVLIADYDGNGVDDILFAANGGAFVRILAFGNGPPTIIDLEGVSEQPPYYGDQRIADIEIADLDGDGDQDIVVVTDQDNIGVYVYRSGPGGPALWGS
ncbi:MAG: VCBS repeat-containing protein [Myxococcales bacterium]|nr:VCBS repeat-containing protein [Myxococcales bacterium]